MKEKIKKVKDIPLNWYKKLLARIKTFAIKRKIFVNIAKQFLIAVIAHGFMVNFMLWSLCGFKFNIYTMIGYGILTYFIKEEFVSFVRRIIFKR